MSLPIDQPMTMRADLCSLVEATIAIPKNHRRVILQMTLQGIRSRYYRLCLESGRMDSPRAIAQCSIECDEFITSIKVDAAINASPAGKATSFKAWGRIGPIIEKYCCGSLYFIAAPKSSDEEKEAEPKVEAEPETSSPTEKIKLQSLLYDDSNSNLWAVAFRRPPGQYGDLTPEEESYITRMLKQLNVRRDPESLYSRTDQVIKIRVL